MELQIANKYSLRQIWIGIFLLALLLRVTLLYFSPQISRDGIYYVYQATGDLREDIPVIGVQAPLFPALLKGMYLCGISPHSGGLVLNLIVGSLIPLLVFMLANELKIKSFWCCFAALLAVVYPSFVQASIDVLRESLYLLFSALMVLLLVKGINNEKSGQVYFVCAGAAGAAAALSRFEGWEAFAIVPLFLLIAQGGLEKPSRRKLCLFLADFFCGWIAGIFLILAMIRYPYGSYFGILDSYLSKIFRFL